MDSAVAAPALPSTDSRCTQLPPDDASEETLLGCASDKVRRPGDTLATEADLIQRYGADNVRRETVALGEGESEPGTTLSDPTRFAAWRYCGGDTIECRRPDRVEIRGRASRWVVAPGVSLGTTLAELERMNGRPFLLCGFGWDYSGTVNSWDGGRLDSLWSRAAGAEALVGLRVDATMNAGDAASIAVEGEKLFKSSHAGMAARKPKVYDLWVHPR